MSTNGYCMQCEVGASPTSWHSVHQRHHVWPHLHGPPCEPPCGQGEPCWAGLHSAAHSLDAQSSGPGGLAALCPEAPECLDGGSLPQQPVMHNPVCCEYVSRDSTSEAGNFFTVPTDPHRSFGHEPQSSSHMRIGGICKLACKFRDKRLTA